MADVVPLHSRSKGEELLMQYRHLLDSDQHFEFIPLDHLEMLREVIDASLRPARLADVGKAVALLVASYKIPGNLEDRPTFTMMMISDLATYPVDILDKASRRARRTIKWLPSIAEMVEICDDLVAARRQTLLTVEEMISRHRRGREKAERQRQFEEQAARISALYGDKVALSPREIELATFLRPIMHWPIGKMFAWHECLDRGEPWAARFCSRLALVARAQCLEGAYCSEDYVQIRREHTVALAELVIADEAAARRQVAYMEAGNIKGRFMSTSESDLETAIQAIEAAAWSDRGIFEGDLSDLSALGPFVQDERFGLGPVPPSPSLNFQEDPQQSAAALKHATEVFEAQRLARPSDK
jgi:hypothetical protein